MLQFDMNFLWSYSERARIFLNFTSLMLTLLDIDKESGSFRDDPKIC